MLASREGLRLRLFENMVLRRLFGPKRDDVRGKWRSLLNDLYSSLSIFRVITSRIMRWAEHVTRMRERRGAYRVMVGKTELKTHA